MISLQHDRVRASLEVSQSHGILAKHPPDQPNRGDYKKKNNRQHNFGRNLAHQVRQAEPDYRDRPINLRYDHVDDMERQRQQQVAFPLPRSRND